jgi:hypothetical protein
MKKTLFLLLLLPLLGRGLGGGLLVAQTVSNLQVNPGAAGSPSTVTFEVSWKKADLDPMSPWLDSMWVFVDYNKNGKMTRMLITGGTLTAHTADVGTSPDAGKLIILMGNDKGAWVSGDARGAAGSFSATVQLLTATADLYGACAYASSYPPVGQYVSDTEITFSGTPWYELKLLHEDGNTVETIESGGTFLLPCSYTVSSFTDATGAPGIIKCLAPTNLTLTASPETICAGATVTLTASATGAASYSINGSAWYASPVFEVSPSSTTAYTLYAKTAEGCVASAAGAAAVEVTQPGAEGEEATACACASGLNNCSGTCKVSCTAFTLCETIVEVSDNPSDGYGLLSAMYTLCTNKGAGWRIPELGELACLCSHREELPGGYASVNYWTPTYASFNRRYIVNFPSCSSMSSDDISKATLNHVRCVK